MNYSTLDQAIEQAELPVEIDALSVYRAFKQVEDGRHKRGLRYSVALILTLIVLAKLAGMTTPAAIAEWVRLLSSMGAPGLAGHAADLSLRFDGKSRCCAGWMPGKGLRCWHSS